jgi:adenylate cyclase
MVELLRCRGQRGMAAKKADVPQEVRMQFWIGIHVGDILIDDNDNR